MTIKPTNSAARSRFICSSLPQPTPICPNACCLLHEIRTNDLPKGLYVLCVTAAALS